MAQTATLPTAHGASHSRGLDKDRKLHVVVVSLAAALAPSRLVRRASGHQVPGLCLSIDRPAQVGGSLGGLFAGISLVRQGHNVVILERSRSQLLHNQGTKASCPCCEHAVRSHHLQVLAL